MGMKKGIYQWNLALVAVIFQFTAQLITAGLMLDITQYFHASASQAGFMLSSYYILYALIQVPAGAVVSRLGPKQTFILGHVVFSLSSLILIYASNLYIAFIGRILMGMSLGCHYVSFAKTTEQWLPAIYFGRFIALQELLVVVFQIIFNLALASTLNIKWQSVIELLAISSLLLAIFFVFSIKSKSDETESDRMVSLKQIKYIVKQMIRDHDFMFKTMIGACLFSFLTVIYGNWWPTFLSAARQVSIAHAIISNQFIAIGMILGMSYLLLFANIDDTKQTLIRFATLAAFGLLVILWWPNMPSLYLDITMVLVGFTSSAYCLGFTELGHKPFPKAVSVGFVNGVMLMLAPILQTLIALVSSLFHWICNLPNTSVSVLEYQIDLSVLPFIQLVIIVGYMSYLYKKRSRPNLF